MVDAKTVFQEIGLTEFDLLHLKLASSQDKKSTSAILLVVTINEVPNFFCNHFLYDNLSVYFIKLCARRGW